MKNKKLKIAVFCASEFAIPPSRRMKDIYAPLWLTHYIAEGLVEKGHDVTLFASSDSKTKAKLISNNLISLNQNKKFKPFYQQVSEMSQEEMLKYEGRRRQVIYSYDFLLISKLYETALQKKFDIVYVGKIGLRPLPFAALCPTPTVLTQHSPLNKLSTLILKEYKQRYPQMHFVALTRSHAKPAPRVFSAIVNNGIELDKFKFNANPKDYLLVVGRLDEEKGIYEAIRVVKESNHKLLIVGRKTEGPYWSQKIKPYLDDKVKFQGFVPYSEMPKYYRQAKALLFPIQWEEPFGLVMIEAMACGTPVIAFRRGSVPEVMQDKKTGFILKPFDEKKRPNIAEAVLAVDKIKEIKRTDCRQWVEDNFSVERMVNEYEKLFYKILKKK